LAYWYGRTLAIGTPLVDLLAAGLCPHDYTSLGMLDRAGGLSMPEGMTRVEYMSATPRHTLRAMVCRRRPAAKVANFGLLYLISLKGLWEKGVIDGVAWSEHEASQLHASWYEDFPEVRFTQEFILATCRDANQELMTVQDRYGAGLEAKPIRLHRSKTLGGREIVTHDDRVINARAQGTGATIALKALVDAPACIRSVVLMLVHDSVLIQAPTEKADFFAAELVSCMTAAASAYLTALGVPVVVETKRGKNWGALS
jgi:DNA polymerase I-like protein with 3'-5' exonuclease and polymerase domains